MSIDRMTFDRIIPNRLRKSRNEKLHDLNNPPVFLPIKQLSRRVQLQKNFDNFNHSCNYLKNVIRIGTRSQIPCVIIALMEHVSSLLKLCDTWSSMINDPENLLSQYRRDVLVNLTELVKILDFFEETGENNSQATHILYKVFMSIERLKNTLFESLPPEDDNDQDSCSSAASTPGSPPLSPKLGTNSRIATFTKAKSIPTSITHHITELEHSPMVRRRLQTPVQTHSTKSMIITHSRNHLSNQPMSGSFSSINIRSSSSIPNIANGGHNQRNHLQVPANYKTLVLPLPNSLTHSSSLGSELEYNGNTTPTPMKKLSAPNSLQYKKRFQAMKYDPFQNRTHTYTYDTDLDAPALPVKSTRNIIPQLVYNQDSVRRNVWEDNCIGKVRDRANTTDHVIEQSQDSLEVKQINLSPKGSTTPDLRHITRVNAVDSMTENSSFPQHSYLSSGTISSPDASPLPRRLTQDAAMLNRTLSITEQEYEEARVQVAAQLRNTTIENGAPAIPPKRRQVISYLTLLKQQTHSYEFPVDEYEPLYVAHTSPAVLPPPMPVKKRNSRNLEKSTDSEFTQNIQYDHSQQSSLGSEIEFKTSPLSESTEKNPLYMYEVTHLLQFIQEDEGHSLRGGPPDALIAYATTVSSSQIGNIFCEAFIHTYTTFINFENLLDKLSLRFFHMKQKKNFTNCKNIIILLTRTIRELRISISEEHKMLIQQIIYSLIIDDLILGISLKQELDSYQARLRNENSFTDELPPSPRDFSLPQSQILEFKASIMAEQMTLMDMNLFKKVTNQELLAWAKDQTEGYNLSKFTAHFNNVSYWCQTRILTQENENLRKDVLRKIMKVMKYLRRMNNFNSYNAVFSSLESSSISRLELLDHFMKEMEEPRALMNPTKSFKSFRKTYAETNPPCISHLCLYLNDLTFINLGTKEFLDDEEINLNFSKQWTLYQTLKQLDKCRHKDYEYKVDKSVVDFFGDFSDHLSEKELYQLSCQIRPRAIHV
ncbi:Rap guanine nucleotide exchange factor 1-like isoform X7 [Oopsacas minuta]|uniref:Rap guanine nucleotide exchange factor 1-like isoform X7 n=1 Tax=Oopsacas minuta TaxID=111878 RepID=A0AAV7JFR8_9METZ|nr:Rap guanine nucleotide exchange factor 1-like isoform X7 [Oopsacas minuta]